MKGRSEHPEPVRVLVVNHGATSTWLADHLDKSRFVVVGCAPGAAFLEVAPRERASIAVLDHVNERPEAAEMEVVFLKELRADVRIIAISEKQTPGDAWVAERGVFFYMTLPPGPELLRVLDAAERSTRSSLERRS